MQKVKNTAAVKDRYWRIILFVLVPKDMCYTFNFPNLFLEMCYGVLYLLMAAAIYTPIRIPENVMEKIHEEMKKEKVENKSQMIISLLKKQLKIKK